MRSIIRYEIKNILLFIFCLAMVLSCKKEQEDYRAKFIGNYYFTIYKTNWKMPDTASTDTTYYYNGKVEYGSQDNTILIYFAEKSSSRYFLEPIIYEDGTLEKTYNCGEFESIKKVKLYIEDFGPGYDVKYQITGERK